MWTTILSLLPSLKSVWTFLTSKLGLVILSVLIIFLLVRSNQSYKKQVEVSKKNFQAVLSDKDIQIQLSKTELAKFYPLYIEKAKELSIKSKDIQTIVETQYLYKDSIIHQDSIKYVYLKDTVDKNVEFIAHKDCYTVYGEGKDTTTKINKIEFKDDLTTFIYRAYDHKFLFFRWGEYIRVKEYSDCLKDTVHISGNIRVQ